MELVSILFGESRIVGRILSARIYSGKSSTWEFVFRVDMSSNPRGFIRDTAKVFGEDVFIKSAEIQCRECDLLIIEKGIVPKEFAKMAMDDNCGFKSVWVWDDVD